MCVHRTTVMTNHTPQRGIALHRTTTNDEAMLLLRDRQQASIDLNRLLQRALNDARVVDKYQTFRARYLLALGKLRPAEYEEPDGLDEDEVDEYLRQLRIQEKEKKERCSKLQNTWLLYETLASDKPSAYNAEDLQIEEEMDEFEEEIFEEWHDFGEDVLVRAEFEGNPHEPDIADWNFELKEIRKDLKLIQRRKTERAEVRERELSRVRDIVRQRRGEDTSETCYGSSEEDDLSKRSCKTSKTSKTSKSSKSSSKSKKKDKKEKIEDKTDDSEHVDDESQGEKLDQTPHSTDIVRKKKHNKDKKSGKKSEKKHKHKKKHTDIDTQERLLEEVFPAHIAKALREGGKPEPESRECVTIFFSDIVGFTNISSALSPLKVSDMLDRLYQKFDSLSHEHDVYKVETIGDSWMGVTNLVKVR